MKCTLEYSNRGFQTDGDAVYTLSLQYINKTARFTKPFYKDFKFENKNLTIPSLNKDDLIF